MSEIQVYDLVDVVPVRLYRELLIHVEQRAHARLDRQVHGLEFFERGQEWVTDPVDLRYRMLKVWGLVRVPFGPAVTALS